MEKILIAKIKRGEKWFKVQQVAEFAKDGNTLDWLNAQVAIVSDIEAYSNSIKPQETKPKEKK